MEDSFVLDTKPIPVIGLKRDKRHSNFSGSATPGWCAARQMNYFGYKLVLLATWQGSGKFTPSVRSNPLMGWHPDPMINPNCYNIRQLILL